MYFFLVKLEVVLKFSACSDVKEKVCSVLPQKVVNVEQVPACCLLAAKTCCTNSTTDLRGYHLTLWLPCTVPQTIMKLRIKTPTVLLLIIFIYIVRVSGPKNPRDLNENAPNYM